MLHWRLLLDLLRMREWVLGTGFMITGLLLSALALDQGEVSLVEPLLATNLVFAMALSRVLTRQTLGRSGWLGVLLLGFGVTVFIVAGQPTGGGPQAGQLRQWLVIGVVVGLTVLLVTLARHLPLFEEATLLALAAGLLYGLQDALTRWTAEELDHGGLGAVVGTWQPYTVLAAGVVGLLLVQSAFEAAPLRMSLPALTAAQPIAGIACAVGFLGDRLRLTPAALTWEAIGLVCIVVGVVVIGRHPAMPGSTDRAAIGDGTGDGAPGSADGGSVAAPAADPVADPDSGSGPVPGSRPDPDAPAGAGADPRAGPRADQRAGPRPDPRATADGRTNDRTDGGADTRGGDR